MAAEVREIMDSLAAFIRTELSLPTNAVAVEPTEQHTAKTTADIYWEGGNAGDADGNILIGGRRQNFTDRFDIDLYSTGTTTALLNSQKRLSLALNFDWVPPSSVQFHRVDNREISRQRLENAKRSPVKSVSISMMITYIES